MSSKNPYLPDSPNIPEAPGMSFAGLPILGFGLMMGRCNPMFRSCLLFHLGKGGPPVCPPPQFMMTRMVASTLRQCSAEQQQSFLQALGVASEGAQVAEADGGVPPAVLDIAEQPEEIRQFLTNAEEHAEAFDALDKEVQGQGAAALNAMLALMKANPGLRISLNS
jgi:hypothetical protein